MVFNCYHINKMATRNLDYYTVEPGNPVNTDTKGTHQS